MRHSFPFIALLMVLPMLSGGGRMAAGGMCGVAAGTCSTAADDSSASRTEVLFETTEGNIRIVLFNETPIHRDNFVKHIDGHFYDSVLFHRVIRNFMIQAGDPDSRTAPPGVEIGEGDCGYTLPAESSDSYSRMAFTLDSQRSLPPAMICFTFCQPLRSSACSANAM